MDRYDTLYRLYEAFDTNELRAHQTFVDLLPPIDAAVARSAWETARNDLDDGKEEIREAFECAIEDGQAYDLQGRLIREDGEQRWTYETTLPALTLRGSSSPVITPSGKVIAGFSNGTLVAVEADNGVWSWEERVAVPEGQYDIDRVIDIDGQLLLDGSRVLASSYQGNLMALDVNTGRIVWGRAASSFHGLERGFGNLYYVDDEGVLTAVRDNSEDVMWENSDLKYREVSAPRAIGNYVAVADFEGYVHLISQIDGHIAGRIRADSDGVRASMLSANGLLYVYGNSGKLTAYRLN